MSFRAPAPESQRDSITTWDNRNTDIYPERVEANAATTLSMAQSLSKIHLHMVFSTNNRDPFLRDHRIRGETHSYLGGILTQLDCPPSIVGGIEDHVHLLFTLSRTRAVADVAKELKRASSVWLKTKSAELAEFAWQSGYGAFSIGHSQLDATRAYIANQEAHHRKTTFQDEFRLLLQRYEVEYDEAYLWD